MRRPWHRHRFPDGVRGPALSGSGRGACPRRGTRCAARRRRNRRDKARRSSGFVRRAPAGREILSEQAARFGPCNRLSESTRSYWTGRCALRHRLRPRRLAASGACFHRLSGQNARNRGPGHCRGVEEALRPFSRPNHVPDSRFERPSNRFWRTHPRQRGAKIP